MYDAPGEAFGSGGLGLDRQRREGGGGSGEGVGLGTIGALGHGIGTGRGRSVGAGYMIGTPGIRVGATSVNGRLPPETIQRIVRKNFGRFRLCHENALRLRPPRSRESVTVRFLIDRLGAVATAADGGELPGRCDDDRLRDPGVHGAVVPGARRCRTVTVVYPIAFAPEG